HALSFRDQAEQDMVVWRFRNQLGPKPEVVENRLAMIVEAGVQAPLEPEHALAAQIIEAQLALSCQTVPGRQRNHQRLVANRYDREIARIGMHADNRRGQVAVAEVP